MVNGKRLTTDGYFTDHAKRVQHTLAEPGGALCNLWRPARRFAEDGHHGLMECRPVPADTQNSITVDASPVDTVAAKSCSCGLGAVALDEFSGLELAKVVVAEGSWRDRGVELGLSSPR